MQHDVTTYIFATPKLLLSYGLVSIKTATNEHRQQWKGENHIGQTSLVLKHVAGPANRSRLGTMASIDDHSQLIAIITFHASFSMTVHSALPMLP